MIDPDRGALKLNTELGPISTLHTTLQQIPRRILENAKGALMQANTHAVYFDPDNEHWGQMGVLHAALAGELFLKAIIAKEHPLLIFRDLYHLDQPQNVDISLNEIIENGRTYNFEHLPRLLWVTTGERIADPSSFEKLRKARNSIQHFCLPDDVDLRGLSLEFLYNNIDPLIRKHFGIYSIEYHEDHSVSYDYIVSCLISHGLRFSIPPDFTVTEIDLASELENASKSYQKWFADEVVCRSLTS